MSASRSLVCRPLLYGLKCLVFRPTRPSPGEVVRSLHLERVRPKRRGLHALEEDAQLDPGLAMGGLVFRGDIIHEAKDALVAGTDGQASRRLQSAVRRHSWDSQNGGGSRNQLAPPMSRIRWVRESRIGVVRGEVEVLVHRGLADLVIGTTGCL